jgi:hypothetical protein
MPGSQVRPTNHASLWAKKDFTPRGERMMFDNLWFFSMYSLLPGWSTEEFKQIKLTIMALAATPNDERGSSMKERFFLGGRGTSLAKRFWKSFGRWRGWCPALPGLPGNSFTPG